MPSGYNGLLVNVVAFGVRERGIGLKVADSPHTWLRCVCGTSRLYGYGTGFIIILADEQTNSGRTAIVFLK